MPAMPSGADSGGGAGSAAPGDPAGDAGAGTGGGAADRAGDQTGGEGAADWADGGGAADRAGGWGTADWAGGGVACGQGRDGDAGAPGAAFPGAAFPGAAVTGPGAGRCSHQRWSAGTVGKAGAPAGCARVVSRLRPGIQSGSQHSCSFLASSSTCGSRNAASCFQASVLNGGKKSVLANSRFLELYRASQRPGSLPSATSDR